MKIELIEQTMIYNITVDENEYTLYVSENQNSYCNYELVDSEGSIVDDDDLLEAITEELNDMPVGFLD
jgi:hypothetical protein